MLASSCPQQIPINEKMRYFIFQNKTNTLFSIIINIHQEHEEEYEEEIKYTRFFFKSDILII